MSTIEKRIELDIIDFEKLKRLIEEKCHPEPNTGCLLWPGARHQFGYGSIRYKKKTYSAHRIIYQAHFGKIKSNDVVRHKCDVPQCCNIEHLLIGTQADNMKDVSIRNRARNQYSGAVYCKNSHLFSLITKGGIRKKICRICNNETQKKRRANNKRPLTEKEKVSRKIYREKNKEKMKEYFKEYYLKRKMEKENGDY